MAQSDSAFLESLKTARDAVVTAIATGDAVVEYTIRGRTVRREPSTTLLTELEKLISVYERKANRTSSGPMRVARLSRVTGIGTS